MNIVHAMKDIVLYAISDLSFFITYYILHYRQKIVRKNLRNSFPEKSFKELRVIEKVFYRNLADYSVETLKLLTIPQQELARRMVFTNPELIQRYYDEKNH